MKREFNMVVDRYREMRNFEVQNPFQHAIPQVKIQMQPMLALVKCSIPHNR